MNPTARSQNFFEGVTYNLAGPKIRAQLNEQNVILLAQSLSIEHLQLLDHFIGADQNTRWNRQPEGFGGAEVDRELVSCRFLQR